MPAPAAAAAETTLAIDNVVITPSGGGSQTIHIAGDASQPISFELLRPGAARLFRQPRLWGRSGASRPRRKLRLVQRTVHVHRHGDLTIVYAGDPRTPVDRARHSLHDHRHDPGRCVGLGLLTLRFKSDLEVWRPGTWYQGPGTYDSTTKFVAALHNLGPDAVRNLPPADRRPRHKPWPRHGLHRRRGRGCLRAGWRRDPGAVHRPGARPSHRSRSPCRPTPTTPCPATTLMSSRASPTCLAWRRNVPTPRGQRPAVGVLAVTLHEQVRRRRPAHRRLSPPRWPYRPSAAR